MRTAVNPATPSLARYRWAVCSRTLAGLVGGYALSACFAAALGLVLARWTTQPRVDAVTWSTMLSFVVMAIAVLWAFGCRSALRAWVGIAVPGAVLGAVWWLLSGSAA